MIRAFDPYFLEWLGRTFGKDQEDYLVCGDCKTRYDWDYDDIEGSPHACSCGGELYAHIPDSEAMVVRWRVWKSRQKWWPQRYHVWPTRNERNDEQPYHYWAFLGREWLRRPDPRPDWWDEIMDAD